MKLYLLQKNGLGNQLFQYAAALYFAKRHNASLEVIREPENLAVSFGRPRPFMLSHFCISAPVRDLSTWDRLMCSVAASKKLVAIPARSISRTSVYRQPVREEGIFNPGLPIPSGSNNVYLEGNFQIYQYAQAIEQELRTEFSLRNLPTGKNLEVLEQIKSTPSTVSVHVRRGDYVVRGGGPQVLSLTYHANSMSTLAQKLGEPTFFVFSDDIAYAREHLPKYKNMVYVDHNGEATGYEDLRLMSACQHNILANSTFSWWGAWLNSNPEKLVCAPASWHNIDPTIPYPDLIPPNWLRVSNK